MQLDSCFRLEHLQPDTHRGCEGGWMLIVKSESNAFSTRRAAIDLPIPPLPPGRRTMMGRDKADFVYASVRTSVGDSMAILLLCSPLIATSGMTGRFLLFLKLLRFAIADSIPLLPLHTAVARRAHSPDAMKLRASGMPANRQHLPLLSRQLQ